LGYNKFGSQFDHAWIIELKLIPFWELGELYNPEPFWIKEIAKLLQNNHDRLSGRCLVTAVTVEDINYLATFGLNPSRVCLQEGF
jgi:hypothetical protein